MRRLVLLSVLALAAGGAVAAGGSVRPDVSVAARSSQPRIVGSPVVRFLKLSRKDADGLSNKYTIGGIVRFDRRFPNTYAVVVAPTLRVGQPVGRVFGGSPGGRVGKADKHCYNVEMIQPEPTRTPRVRARWMVGVLRGDRVQSVKRVTLRRDNTRGNPLPDARRLGCLR